LSGKTVTVPPEILENLICQGFNQTGCSEDEAIKIAHSLIGANLRGHDSHGVIRFSQYIDWCKSGTVVPNQQVKILQENDVILILDGQYGFGQSIGAQTVELGIKKALSQGVAVTSLRNSGHLGRIGEWAEQAAEANVGSLHMVNVRGSSLVAPFGGVRPRAGTNPFCCCIPRPGRPPVVLDFATSMVAEGKARVALNGGKPLPEGAIMDSEGNLTSDPVALYGIKNQNGDQEFTKEPGALTGFGLHKGSGLNFFMEIFGGALTGSGTAAVIDEPKRSFCNGMLSVYFAMNFFDSDNWIANEIRGYIEMYKSSTPVISGEEVLIPGEPELKMMKKRSLSGLPLSMEVWQNILKTAEDIGVDESQIPKTRRACRINS
jgi:uncharacterized oxidoreductase